MEEFLSVNYSILTYAVELLAAIAALFCYSKYKTTKARYFIYFLLFVLGLELLGAYPYYVNENRVLSFLNDTWLERNFWVYTIFWHLGSGLFLSFYFKNLLNNSRFKLIVKLLSVGFVLYFVLYYGTHLKLLFSEFTYTGIILYWSLLILVSVVFYLIELLQSDKLLNFYNSIDFYIAVIWFIWLIIITPLTFYNVYFTTADLRFVILKGQIYLLANIFMYLMFTFALLWCKPQNN